jgi:hypothetical protein
MRSILIVTAIFLSTSACTAGNVRLTQQEISPVYQAGEFAYAGAGRDLR